MKFEPRWIAWEITQRCNLHCIHCRTKADINKKDNLTFREALRIIDDISGYAKPTIVLTGGEPLLRKDVFDIAKYGTKKGLKMCLATNGTLVDDKMCEMIKENGIQVVSVSIDGSSKQVHDDFRKQKEAFDGVINAIKRFQKHNIKFLINSAFTKRNIHDVKNVYKLCKELKPIAWYMFTVVPTGRAKNISKELLDGNEIEEALRWHLETELKEKDMIMRPTCAPYYYRLIEEKNFKNRKILKFSPGGFKGCVAGQFIAFIDEEENVKPCSYFLRNAGNLKQHSFSSIWEKSKIFRNLRNKKKHKGKCGRCKYLGVCGGCRVKADAVYRDYMQEDPTCTYEPS
jgi:radical SAM protein with 4Fe4S-binding SPASM domain